MNAVHITGLGAICASGLDKDSIYDRCLQGESSVNADGLASLSLPQWIELKNKTAPAFHHSRCQLLSFATATAAIKDAGWSANELRDCGFIFASTTSQIDQWEKDLPLYRQPGFSPDHIRRAVSNQSLGTPLLVLAEHFQIQGPQMHLASSCSASLQALAVASMWIQSGRVKRCLVGGTEIQSELTRQGFQSLRLLAKAPCRPFDDRRNGINLGEGSAFVCLEAEGLAPARWGRVAGVGLSTDAHHATSPHPQGLGAQVAMRNAMQSAQKTTADIDWIYAHGTASPANDAAEAQAIHALFHAPIPVSSSKSSHGHTLAASGVLESVLGLMSLRRQLVLPTAFCEQPDPALDLSVSAKAREIPMRAFLKNSLGFGGLNASICFDRGPA